MPNYEDAIPNPEYLIKSIAEQGYSLETALADLIDNSIYAQATKIEILIDTDKEPFTLFLADNGLGMNENTLRKSMQFPSKSSEDKRNHDDLGRFGLGLKTASFSQTRNFSVLSKKSTQDKFSSRTWDVEFLKKTKLWQLKINSDLEINRLFDNYKFLSSDYLNKFDRLDANTIIVWQGLYKFENYLSVHDRKNALKQQITEVTSDYLSLVFHRFLERKVNPVQIRINNKRISPFNPFPVHETDFRPIEYKQKAFGTDNIKIEGFVLPIRNLPEATKIFDDVFTGIREQRRRLKLFQQIAEWSG